LDEAAGSCPCLPDIGHAVTAHRQVVGQQARLLLHPDDSGYDDLVSDGMLALWLALASYDPDRGDLESWLVHRVKFRMIDGLRQHSGQGSAVHPQPPRSASPSSRATSARTGSTSVPR
jgi:RNA polymerase sigma factor (sigma-70 family)